MSEILLLYGFTNHHKYGCLISIIRKSQKAESKTPKASLSNPVSNIYCNTILLFLLKNRASYLSGVLYANVLCGISAL